MSLICDMTFFFYVILKEIQKENPASPCEQDFLLGDWLAFTSLFPLSVSNFKRDSERKSCKLM